MTDCSLPSAVGIIPKPGHKFNREALEETVLTTQKMLEVSPIGRRVPFCAFNGGNDVFVDIGDKNFGVRVCQRYFASSRCLSSSSDVVSGSGGFDYNVQPIDGSKTLHIGDQFLSAGANDFKARHACTTAWIASPAETIALLDEIELLDQAIERKNR